MSMKASYSINSINFSSSIIVSTNPIVLLGLTVYNSGPAQFILPFDLTSVPANGAVPLIPYAVPAGATLALFFGTEGKFLKNGLVLSNSTTAGTKTLGAADCWFDVQVRVPTEK